MPRDLSYKDARKSQYISEFADEVPSTIPNGSRPATTASGVEVDQLEVKQLLNTLRMLGERLQSAEHKISSLTGQLEYIHKNGIDSYDNKIRGIRDNNPMPQ